MNKKQWTLRQQAELLKRLGELIAKGYSLSQAIEFIAIHASKSQKHDLNRCLVSLKEGVLLHEALEKLNFKRVVLSYLFFANQHGDMHEALLESSKMLDMQFQYRERMFKMMKYPLFLFCIVGIMMYMIQSTLIPQFETLLSTLGNNEMLFAEINTNIAFVRKIATIVGILLLSIFTIYYLRYFRKLSPLNKLRKIIKIPILKIYLRMFISYYFSAQLSTLIQGGLSIYQAIQVFERLPYIPFYQEEARQIKKQLVAGETLESIISSRKYFEPELAIVISHGQANGELGRELADYSHYLVQRLEEKLGKIIIVLQPMMYVSIGIVIIIMYLIMLLPMFKMINTI